MIGELVMNWMELVIWWLMKISLSTEKRNDADQDVTKVVTTNVTNMSSMFYGATAFNKTSVLGM